MTSLPGNDAETLKFDHEHLRDITREACQWAHRAWHEHFKFMAVVDGRIDIQEPKFVKEFFDIERREAQKDPT